ncbi:CBS domain-containing protein [Methylibium rhizosphaerae]|uniref:CBS domain-containing protein n=1 Tax=Methylibium rhizosphaerae TaxID=2570323 RepID=UPI00112618BB|nr:CBS domain-containing protein [Methylibium rhizosphaerae]
MGQPISALMTRQVWRVSMDDTVEQVETLLNARDLHWVPVVEGNGTAVIGVISSTDVLQFHVRRQDARNTRAWQLCTYRPIVVTPDTPAERVARMMLDSCVHHVVVARDNELEGVVSSLDFVRLFAEGTN